MLSQHLTGTRVAFFPWAHGLAAHDMFSQHVARRRVVCFPPARCPKAYGMFPLARGSKVCGMFSLRVTRRRVVCVILGVRLEDMWATLWVCICQGVAPRRVVGCLWRVAKGMRECSMLPQRLARRRAVCFPWRRARIRVPGKALCVSRARRPRRVPCFPWRVGLSRAACFSWPVTRRRVVGFTLRVARRRVVYLSLARGWKACGVFSFGAKLEGLWYFFQRVA